MKTFEIKIYVGLREGYTNIVHPIEEVEAICQKYCNEIGLCVTVTPTKFIYKDGCEKGAVIGLINYPRFPSTEKEILERAEEIAGYCLHQFKQNRISIISTTGTYMIDKKDQSL